MRPLLLMLALCATAAAHEPLGGLTVACSPDGKTVIAGGDNRTLYVVDPRTLKVRRRVWIKTPIFRMAFNKDGSGLLVEDTRETLWLVDTKKWTRKKIATHAAWISPARAVNLCAAYDEFHRGAGGAQPAIKLLSMLDGETVHTLPLGKGARASGFALSPDGTRVAVLFAPKRDAEEVAVPYSKIPRGLSGLARHTFRQKNDGKTSTFRILEVAGGKRLADGELFYSTRRATLAFADEEVLIVAHDNVNARVALGLDVTLFELTNGSNHAIGVGADHATLVTGGLRAGTRAEIGDKLRIARFTMPKLPGGPEYVKGLAVSPDGTVFATTSGYRLARVDADGRLRAIEPIH